LFLFGWYIHLIRQMKTFFAITILFSLVSCSSTSKYEGPVLEPSAITKDMMSWLYYDRDQMQWSADFQPLDTLSKPMVKSDFLELLSTGNYLPVRIKTRDSALCYQLYPINGNVDQVIRETIRNKAQTAYRYLQMEGSSLPGFNFTDLNGNVYNRGTTKGKVVVLNCWFIHCQACNEEMPDLNKLVEQTKGRKDIVFLGLAFDKPDSLKNFLTKKNFEYAIVAEKEDYMRNDLGIIYYPTHIIVNREGKIAKVIDGGMNELIDALNKEIVKKG
jgi:peroxiredoxin